MKYWLMKSEPGTYSIEDLKQDQETIWDGVRNYQARNFLMAMEPGDLAFFYHSNAKPPGVVGLMEISASQVVDPTQFETTSQYYDPKATPESPRWLTVKVTFKQQWSLMSLDQLKQTFSTDQLGVVRRGNRLSVMPVDPDVATILMQLHQPKSS